MKVDDSKFHILSDAADSSRLVSLLLWLNQRFQYFMAGNDVIWNEETIFWVKSQHIQHEPEWSAELVVFDVWSQQEKAVTFKLVET